MVYSTVSTTPALGHPQWPIHTHDCNCRYLTLIKNPVCITFPTPHYEGCPKKLLVLNYM